MAVNSKVSADPVDSADTDATLCSALHIREAAGLTEDPDGSLVPDLRAACAEAAAAAREIAAEHLRAGKPLNALRFEICDGAGQLLATVPFPKVPGPP